MPEADTRRWVLLRRLTGRRVGNSWADDEVAASLRRLRLRFVTYCIK